MPAAVVRFATSDHILATWQCVLVLVWRHETTLGAIEAAERLYGELAAASPQGVFLLNVVQEGAPMPSPMVRSAMARFLMRNADRMILSAVVHEGAGFRGAAVRSVVTGLALLARLPYRHKVFASVDEASEWFVSNSPVARAWGTGALAAAVADLRNRTMSAAHA